MTQEERPQEEVSRSGWPVGVSVRDSLHFVNRDGKACPLGQHLPLAPVLDCESSGNPEHRRAHMHSFPSAPDCGCDRCVGVPATMACSLE